MTINSILHHSIRFQDLSQSYVDTFKNLTRPKNFILHFLDGGSKGLSDPTTPLGPPISPFKIHSSYTTWFHFSPLYIYLATLTKNEPNFLYPFQFPLHMPTHIFRIWTHLSGPHFLNPFRFSLNTPRKIQTSPSTHSWLCTESHLYATSQDHTFQFKRSLNPLCLIGAWIPHAAPSILTTSFLLVWTELQTLCRLLSPLPKRLLCIWAKLQTLMRLAYNPKPPSSHLCGIPSNPCPAPLQTLPRPPFKSHFTSPK